MQSASRGAAIQTLGLLNPTQVRYRAALARGILTFRGLTMAQTRHFTAIIEREGDGFVALCPELDIASQGDTVEEARLNLVEALELFFESADASEVERRRHDDIFITRLEIGIG